VLFRIAANPGCTIEEVAETMALTRDVVSRTMADLSRSGVLFVRENGSQFRYTVNLDSAFLHPAVKGYTLGDVLGNLVEQGQLLMAAAP
jgi:predicted transcriptional regulator